MKIALFILVTLFSCFSSACEKIATLEQAFAVESEFKGLDDKLKVYQVYIPIKLGKMFMDSIDVKKASTFSFALDFHEYAEYEGDFYTAFLSISPAFVNEIGIRVSYNSPDKERSAIAFCGNFKIYKLSELLDVTPPAKRPELPPPPPPPRPESDDV